jgi:uncharacterized membrane protein YqjE
MVSRLAGCGTMLLCMSLVVLLASGIYSSYGLVQAVGTVIVGLIISFAFAVYAYARTEKYMGRSEVGVKGNFRSREDIRIRDNRRRR